MSTRKKAVAPSVDPSKLELIKQGKKKVNVTDFKENKNTISNKDGSKFLAVEKERKFEEAGVTRKKRNFVMYESKTGTEKDVDLLQLEAAKKKSKPRPKVEETIISKHKKKEYLDNFQYHETKNLKNKKPAVVIHNRMSNPITGTVEEYSYQKITSTSAGKTRPGQNTTTTTRTTRTEMKENKSSGNLRNKPRGQPTTVSATKTQESTTKVGRRGGAGGKTSSTTTTKKETTTTTTKGGETKTSTRTTRTRK
jgi:hypothetical protein